MAKFGSANTIKILDIIEKYENNVYDFDPEYQRSFHAWDDKKRNNLLNSIIDDYPIPPIYVIKKNNKEVVIDGKQRITAILNIFDRNSQMYIGNQIRVASLKKFFEFYIDTNDSATGFVYQGKKYICDNTNTIKTIELHGDNTINLHKMNMHQFMKIIETFDKAANKIQLENHLYQLLSDAATIRKQIYEYEFYCSIGSDCTEDDETTLFGYLNAGESLSNSESLNGIYWNYELWRQAKHFCSDIRQKYPDMQEALFGKFRDKDRYQDIEFWADVFLTLYHKKTTSTRLNIRRWKDIRPENNMNGINKTDKLDENKIMLCKSILNKFHEFVTWEGTRDNPDLKLKDDKKTYKVLLALFMTLYMEKEKRPDQSNYLYLGMDRANNLYRVINKGIKQLSYQELLNSLLTSVNLG